MPKEKVKPTFDLELELKNKGYSYVIGVDEAGRGSLISDVVAAGVVIPEGFDTSEINDSKKLSSKKRDLLYNKITNECFWSCAFVGPETIDEINIREATKLAMARAIEDLGKRLYPVYALIDGNFVPELTFIPSRAVVGGDKLSVSIAAASIIAKVERDRYILSLHEKYPIYGWDKNKGYGTKAHRDALKLYGPTKYHRQSFGGVLT